ncbi:MAG: hypothetical protein QF751_07730, partial [Alphaproteobacteria bacterium]|nr:hypothetical protein [Alphaproteobacteria bacterium]
MFLSKEQITEFEDKGFVVLKGFLDKEVMGRVSACLDELRDKQPAAGEEAKYYEKSPVNGENILVRIENVLGDHNPELGELLLPPKAVECLTQL